MKVVDAIAEILKREGVDVLYGYPINPIFDAAAKVGIRTVIVRQERTGLHMADALSRVSSGGRIGVFTMQNGPGSENAFGGIAQAWGESSPIVVIAAGYPRAVTTVPPHFSSYLNFQHITKSSELVTVAAAIPDALRRAFSQVRNGRPRPVMIEVPSDVFGEELPDELRYEPVVRARSAPDPAAIEEAAEVLLRAERPLIYAGQGVHYAQAWEPLRTLAELLEAPVTTSLEGKSAFPETHPLSLGSGGRALPKPVHEFVQRADVIFGVGCSFAATNYGITFPTGKTVIHSTLDANDLNRSVVAQYALIGDARLTLEALVAAVRARVPAGGRGRRDAVVKEIEAYRAEWLAVWEPRRASEATPLSPYRVLRDLEATVDIANTTITHDAGSPRDQLSPFWRCTTPLSYIGWGKTTQLGYGLGLAMGAKLAQPDRLCINVWGDAAIGMTGMDFETAVRERIPILSILLNNFTMAIEIPAMPVSTERYRATDISGNYADFARALGGYGERVTSPAEIVPAIRRGIEQTERGTPALLEFITQQSYEYSTFR